MNSHPPASALVFHVGVTGHRAEALPSSAGPVIRQTVANVLGVIEAEVAAIAQEEAALLPAEGRTVLRLISSLAAGADQLVAEVALERGWELQCPLPFARGEYEKDFVEPASVTEYRALLARATSVFEHDGDRRHEAAAYLEAGRTMLAQSDLVVAVWDGEPSRGVGGTADVVREALAKGMPVVRIDPARPEVPALLGTALADGDWADGARAYLRELLELPEKSRVRLGRYLGETERLGNFGLLFVAFRQLFAGEKQKPWALSAQPYAEAVAKWDAEWRTEPALPAAVGERIDGCLRDQYAWTNGLAETYAGLFRSAYILRYFLVTISVLFGAVGFYAPAPWSWCGFILQVQCLLAAVLLILVDNRKLWQRKAVEYRWIAEQLRIHRYLLPLGRTVLPVAQSEHPIYEGPRWGRRQVRCSVRRIGLATARIDSAYLRAHRAFVLENEIEGNGGQRAYHATATRRNARIAQRLYRWALAFFIVGLVAIILRMGLFYRTELIKAGEWSAEWCGLGGNNATLPLETWIKVAAAVLPALGVMFSSLRAHGEFKRLSARSHAMTSYLEARATALRQMDAPSWAEAVDDTTRLALILRAEVADWNTVMESRGLALPV